jgi:hypothetical protein
MSGESERTLREMFDEAKVCQLEISNDDDILIFNPLEGRSMSTIYR